jgi:hypothetical protein
MGVASSLFACPRTGRGTNNRAVWALVAAVCGLAALAFPGSARAAVVQAHEPGDYLIGHRWAAPATGPQTLTVVAQRNVDWTTITLLDFDRDGKPDAMVNLAWSPGQQDVVWQLWRLTPAAMAPGLGTTGGLPCFTPTPDDATLVGAGHVPEVRRTFTWEVALTHDFGADLGSAYSGLVRYQPTVTTIFTPGARALFSAYTVNDILPNSADPVQAFGDTAHQCSGLVNGTYSEGIQVVPAKGSDRGQATFLPARRQAMFTDATTTDTGQPQLVESDIEQWNASQTTSDLTADVPNPTYGTDHPSDLVLTMRADHPLDTVTYLVADGGKQPIGLVTTSGSANQAAGQAKLHVQLASGLSTLSYPSSTTGNGCYPRSASTLINGQTWGPTPVSFDVPLTAVTGDNGQPEYRAQISLDDVLGIGDGATGDRASFRWVTTSVPGLHFPPEYTPDVAGLDDTDQPFGVCTVPTTGDPDGTQLWPSSMVRMDTTLPSASLASSPSNPHAGATVTLTATTDASSPSYRFDPESTGSWGSFSGSASTNHAYGSTIGGRPFVAHVYLVNGAGTAAMASTTIATDDPPPTASFGESTGSPAPPFVIGTNGPTVSWADHSTDTLGGVVKAWHWDLHKTNWNGTGGISCDATANGPSTDPSCDPTGFSHTFVAGEQGDWVLTLTVTDDGGAKSSTFTTFHVVQPPIAMLDSVTPQPIVINLNTFPVEGDFTIHMRTADDGSLGSEGPLTYFFAGASGSNAQPPFTPFDFVQGADPFSGTFNGREFRVGVFPVQAEVVDTGGRTAYTPVFNVIVRGPGDSPPTADLTTSPGTIQSGVTDVTLDASTSVLNNPDGSTGVPDHFVFDFGDGTPQLDTTSAVVHHTYAGSGQYTASVTVVDDRILPATSSDPATANVAVSPGTTDANAPVARIAFVNPGQPAFAKAPVELTAAASTVHVGDGPAHFAWDLDGDGTFETDTGTNATLSTVYPTAGVRRVKVRVTDARGRSSVSDDLFVGVNPPNDQPPFVQVTGPDTITLTNGTGQATFDASNSVGRNLDGSLTFAWDLNGDGTYETFTGAISHVTATFTSSGVHTVRVRATDIYGNVDVASATIFVRGAAEVAAGCQSKEQYRTASYGKVQLAACWSQVDRPGTAPLWVARNNVLVDGMLLNSPTAGSADQQTFSNCTGSCASTQSAFNLHHGSMIAFDPTNGLLATNMPFAWRATNGVESFVLNQGSLDLMLPTSSDADGLILHPPSGGTFLTFDVASQAEVKFPVDGEATIALTMHMPPQLPGASGDLTLRSTTTQGLIVDHLAIDVTTGLLADKLKLSDLSLEYDRPTQLWSGSAELGIPGIKQKPDFGLKVAVSVQNGKFHSIYGEVNGLEIDLGEGIFLQRIAAGVGVDPIDIQGGLGISAGPEILGTQILSADGDFRLTLPSAAAPYTLFQIAGVTKLADLFDLTKGVARFTTDGFVEARGGLSRESFIGYFDASIGGWFTLHDFELSGDAQAGLLLLGDKIQLIGAKAVASLKGIAACGEIPVLHLGGGLGYHWGGSFDTFTGCDLGPYSGDRPAGIPDGFELDAPGSNLDQQSTGTALPRAFAAVTAVPKKAPTINLPAGLRSVGVTIRGRGGAPRVAIFDAKGKTVLDATKEQLTPTTLVQFDDKQGVTSVLWKSPPKGKFLVLAAPGSAPVTNVSHGLDFGVQHVRARLTGKGSKETLHWSVVPALQRGQRLSLAEQLPSGASVAPGGGAAGVGGGGRAITTTSKSSGSLPFAPEAGHGEQRVIAASIVTDGLARPPQVAARFRAPRVVIPSAPRNVQLRRTGRTVTVSWRPGARLPQRWHVQLQAGPARSIATFLSPSRHSLTMHDVASALAVAASIKGVAASGASGRSAGTRLAAGQLRSGTSVAADTLPRRLLARRSGARLLVSWKPGPVRVAAYSLTVTTGGHVTHVLLRGSQHSAVVRSLPRARTSIRVVLRARRLDGTTGRPVTLAGRR